MKRFEGIWPLTESIPGSFTRLSAEKLYEYALGVPDRGVVVEVGVDQGRSASILLTASEFTHAQLWLIDKWESILIDNLKKVEALVKKFPLVDECVILHGSSAAAGAAFPHPIDLIHIDAHHHDDILDGGPDLDCQAWMPKVRPGGVAAFHDYDSTFHDVKKAVDKYTAGWEDLGNWDSLAIRRKP